jgi:hypothetical protein
MTRASDRCEMLHYELVLKNILMGLPLGRGRPADAANPAGLGDPRCARQ